MDRKMMYIIIISIVAIVGMCLVSMVIIFNNEDGFNIGVEKKQFKITSYGGGFFKSSPDDGAIILMKSANDRGKEINNETMNWLKGLDGTKYIFLQDATEGNKLIMTNEDFNKIQNAVNNKESNKDYNEIKITISADAFNVHNIFINDTGKIFEVSNVEIVNVN